MRIRLQFSALFWVILVRLGLTLRSYEWTRQRFLGRCANRAFGDAPGTPRIGPARVARAVHRAAGLVPNASCLTQALAAQIILARGNVDSILLIGVGKSDAGGFEAHAWLEVGKAVLIGGTRESLSRYSNLTAYASSAP
ncbi:hypothetical protein LCGC14_2234010 [marine sediment metagenome]|uniref:Microcin J25-processing protein McjB C-terminal domain-containing protein n=1 Tax=marine sediment metagenome TaxID=412755 RepID=A0A0F9G2E0_9ZZZZ